jgi:broad specificity phosphatase PhoE
MPRLILVRHAEPAAGWGDHDDPGLSELGAAQAARAALLLNKTGIRRAISSPLARCQETSRAFETLAGVKARIENAVAEIPTPADVEDRRAWLSGVLGGKWSDVGPLLGRWKDGVGAALLSLPEDTVVFSHFVAINAAIGLATNSEMVVAFRPGHASRTELFSDGISLKLVSLGDEAPINLL